eukprot:jgi/Mesvir1/13035/Mv06026-RA.3
MLPARPMGRKLKMKNYWAPLLGWLMARLVTAQVQWWEVSEGGLPARRGAASCMIDNRHMFVFGGQTESGALLSDTWVYSFTDRRWDKIGLPDVTPTPRAFATATVLSGSNVLVIGGMCNGTDPGVDAAPCADMIWEFSRLTGQWHALVPRGEPTPAPRFGHVALATGESTLVLYGGAVGTGWNLDGSAALWRLTHAAATAGSLTGGKASWTFVAPEGAASGWPAGRLGHAGVYSAGLCVFHGGMVVGLRVGGSAGVPGESREVAIFRLDSREWEVLGFSSELARAWHTMDLYQDKYAVIIGGTTPATPSANLPRRTLLEPRWFDVPNKRWSAVPINATRTTLTGAPRSRAQHVSVVLDGNAIVLAGGVRASSLPTPQAVAGTIQSDTWGLDFTGQRIVRRALQVNFDSEHGVPERLIVFWDSLEEASAPDTSLYMFPSVPVGPLVCAATRYGGLVVAAENVSLYYTDSIVVRVVHEPDNRTVAITALMQDGASALPGVVVVANLWNITGRSWIPFTAGTTGRDGVAELKLVASEHALVPARYHSKYELHVVGSSGSEVALLPTFRVPSKSLYDDAPPMQSVITSVAPHLHPLTLLAASDSARATLGPSSLWAYTYLDIVVEAKSPPLRPYDRLVFSLSSPVPLLTLFLSPAAIDPWPSHLDWFWFTGIGSSGGQASFWHTLSTLGANSTADYPVRLRAGVGVSPHSRDSLSSAFTDISFELRIAVERGNPAPVPPPSSKTPAPPPPRGSLGPADQGDEEGDGGSSNSLGLWLGIGIAIAIFLCCLLTVVIVLVRRQRRRRHKHVIRDIADVLSDEERFGAIMAKEMDKARRVPPMVSEYGTEMVEMSHVAGKPAAGSLGDGPGRRLEERGARSSASRRKKEHRRGSGRESGIPLSTRAGELGSIGGADDVESFMHNLEMMAEEYRRTLLTEDGSNPVTLHAAPPLVDIDMHDRYSERERAAAGAAPMVKVQAAVPAPRGVLPPRSPPPPPASYNWKDDPAVV